MASGHSDAGIKLGIEGERDFKKSYSSLSVHQGEDTNTV